MRAGTDDSGKYRRGLHKALGGHRSKYQRSLVRQGAWDLSLVIGFSRSISRYLLEKIATLASRMPFEKAC